MGVSVAKEFFAPARYLVLPWFAKHWFLYLRKRTRRPISLSTARSSVIIRNETWPSKRIHWMLSPGSLEFWEAKCRRRLGMAYWGDTSIKCCFGCQPANKSDVLWDPSKALLLTSRYHLGHGLAGKGRLNYLHTFYSLAKPGEYEFRPEIPLIDDVQSTNVQRLSIESNNNSHQAWTRVQIQSYHLRHRRRPEIFSPISSGNSLKISPTQRNRTG